MLILTVRNWLQDILTGEGARFLGGGIMLADDPPTADMDMLIDGKRFTITIREDNSPLPSPTVKESQ